MSFSIFPRLLSISRTFIQPRSNHTLAVASTTLIQPTSSIAGGSSLWSIFFRTNIRNHFPHARETRRVRVHGWAKRMSTLNGKKILMRRILKGRHVLSH